MRDSLRIPFTTDTASIVVVTGPSTTCQKAAAAYVTALKLDPAVSRQVHVIQVNTVYLVEDPTASVYDWKSVLVVLKAAGFKYLATSFS